MLSYLDVGSARVHDVAFTTRSVTHETLSGAPPVRSDPTDRPEDDGAVESDFYYGPRISTIEGEIWGATTDAVRQDWDLLTAAFEAAKTAASLVKWATIGSSRSVQGYGRVIGDVLFSDQADNQAPLISWQAQFRFADPRWYSQTAASQSVGSPTTDGGMPLPVVFPIPFGSGSSGGSMTVSNSGKTKTWPTLTITGPITGPVVENTTLGRALYFSSLTLAAGQQLIIEMNPAGPRSAKVSGASVLGSLDATRSRWWWLDPGSSSIRFYGSGGGYGVGTNFAESHRDAWLS